MKNIMLICAAGMSTSLMVTKMRKAAEEKNLEADIFAISASEFDETVAQKDIDVVLLGPQVKFMKNQFTPVLSKKNIPIDVINMQYYGMMNGEKVLDQALKLLEI
ncbi:PTS sugar transporter subunit IIB [Bacillus canaveralius]|uniref:PTS sugar transporter subunit IIB n=1 Tax=Bacillus canaveralius TaxID=1403243 RepID=A0A2N5GFP3_9BACI|nr:PTS sugar transporter subunit IIB [Bacillus canaveralius]PLR79579.1 PTS sugar transporter subunit IIB [Bacillus canaveralius]PLR98289.1 PTS sugar transporter subunit IIB [Bacillus canaveralius]RSK53240.1 PTS sugar transporter subunit IIB [Bacillus canaveralius]